MIKYNANQQISIDKLKDFIAQDVENVFYLLGYAGTGKTYVIANMIPSFVDSSYIDQIIMCAPTHKALSVMKSNMDIKYINSNKINFMTVQKLLEFRPLISNSDGEKIFKSVKESKYLKTITTKYTIVVVDESSMIPQDMVKSLNKYTELYRVKLIFLGDSAQLSPVGESTSLVFTQIKPNYKYYTLLDQIMRTDLADIKNACKIIREWNTVDSLTKLLLPLHKKSNPKSFTLYHTNYDHQNSTWFKKFNAYLENANVPIILTWQNSVANNYNDIIRKHIYKSNDLNNYRIGDYLMFNNFYVSPHDESCYYTANMIKIIEISTHEKSLVDWDSLLITGSTCAIDKCFNILIKKLKKLDIKFMIDKLVVKKVALNMLENCTNTIYTINYAQLHKYNTTLELIKNHLIFFFKKYKSEKHMKILWDIYYSQLKDAYAELSFGYAITTNKAQGSTFEIVFVDVNDICKNNNIIEVQKYLYTAASRASTHLGFLL